MSFDVPYWRPPTPRSGWSFSCRLMVSKCRGPFLASHMLVPLYRPGGSSPSKCGSYPLKRRHCRRSASRRTSLGTPLRSPWRQSRSSKSPQHCIASTANRSFSADGMLSVLLPEAPIRASYSVSFRTSLMGCPGGICRRFVVSASRLLAVPRFLMVVNTTGSARPNQSG
jgi:hypothetical protein